jgi:ribonuclease P protein component
MLFSRPRHRAPENCRETHVSAAPQAPHSHPRLPRAHENGFGSPGPEQAAPQRPQAACGHDLSEVSPSRGSPEGFPRLDRLLRRADFLRVQREGKRVHTPHFVVMVLPSAHQRMGVTVTRRIAGAVGRNRIKRLAREVFRRERAVFPARCDLVLVARAGADQLDYAALRSELVQVRAAMARVAARTGARGQDEAPP